MRFLRNLHRRPRPSLAVALFAVVLLPTSAVAQDLAAHQKLDTALDDVVHHPGGGTPPTRRVIILATPGLIRQTLVANGHQIQSELNLVDGLTVDLSPAELEALAMNPLVASLSNDAEVRATQDSTATAAGGDGAALLRDTLGLTDVSPQGRGVGVAIIRCGSTTAKAVRSNSSGMGAYPRRWCGRSATLR